MHITIVFGLCTILLLGVPAYAQNPCVDCLKAVQEQLKQCLGEAMSHEDKKSCAERHLAKANVCENDECVIERTTSHNNYDVLPQKK